MKKINEAAGEVGAIIHDAPIQRIGVVPNHTSLTNDYGASIVIGSIDEGFSPGATSEFGGVTTSYILDPSTKPGKLPSSYWSDGVGQGPTTGELTRTARLAVHKKNTAIVMGNYWSPPHCHV